MKGEVAVVHSFKTVLIERKGYPHILIISILVKSAMGGGEEVAAILQEWVVLPLKLLEEA